MDLLCPKAPFLAVPENVIDVKLSTPIAFDVAAMIELAFCAAALIEMTIPISAAPIVVVSRISYPSNLRIKIIVIVL